MYLIAIRTRHTVIYYKQYLHYYSRVIVVGDDSLNIDI